MMRQPFEYSDIGGRRGFNFNESEGMKGSSSHGTAYLN